MAAWQLRRRPTDAGLVERELQLAALGQALAEAAAGHGRIALVYGEAGVGKTALVRRFSEEHASGARVLRGVCDPLFTPRPLGALLDLAAGAGGELEQMVRDAADSHDVAAALVVELRSRTPAILVVEDVHWADEATLDVLKLLVRQIEPVPALLVMTYRDDELEATHPLRHLLGQLVSLRAIRRVPVERLSLEAVEALAEPHEVDGGELYRKTAGNPFFVTEVLAAPGDEIPTSVRDAVLARCARLDGGGARPARGRRRRRGRIPSSGSWTRWRRTSCRPSKTASPPGCSSPDTTASASATSSPA